jgi:hypothetical protein
VPRAAKPDFKRSLSQYLRAVASRFGRRSAINPGWSRSPRNAVTGWKHGLLITDFARFITSEIALLCEWRGSGSHGDLLVGSGGTYEEIA